MRSFIVVATVLTLAACGTKGGTGFTDTSVPVVGEFDIQPGTKHRINLISADGWTCTGPFDTVKFAHAQRSVYPFPLTCDNGDKGNAIYTIPAFNANRYYQPGVTQVSFTLQSGVRGYVKF